MASRMRMYLAAGVAVLALIAAGDAFLTSPAIPSSQKSVATAYRSTVRGSELKSSKGDSFWKAAASMTLLSLSVARLVGSTAKAPSRRVVSVRCCAAAPLVAAASQVKEWTERPSPTVTDLIDMTVPEITRGEVLEDIFTEAGMDRPSSPLRIARFIGASRFRAARRAARSTSRATRHATGKRLCERPSTVVMTQSFDFSRLRHQIQKGLRISSRRRCGHSRQGRGVAASSSTAISRHSLMEVELHVQKAYSQNQCSIDRCSVLASSLGFDALCGGRMWWRHRLA